MMLSIIIPAYNEKDTIEEVIRRVMSVDLSKLGVEREILVIDDGSTDGTREILKQYQVSSVKCQVKGQADNQKTNKSVNDIKVIFHEKNMGKGAAIQTGFRNVKGDIIMIQDADLELEPEEHALLLEPIVQGRTKVVFGSRFKKRVIGMSRATFIANMLFTFLTNFLYRSQITDVMTCYKVIHKDVADRLKLKSNKFDIEPELAAKICKCGYKIYEIPVSYVPRTYGKGKKIVFSDSFPVIWALIKYRFID